MINILREQKLAAMMDEPMSALDYLKVEQPYLDLTEYGAHSRAAQILSRATGISKHTIRRHWGDNFEKCPLHAQLALRKDHLIRSIARQDVSLARALAA